MKNGDPCKCGATDTWHKECYAADGSESSLNVLLTPFPQTYLKRVGELKLIIVDYITDRDQFSTFEASEIRNALSELEEYKKLASIYEVKQMLNSMF